MAPASRYSDKQILKLTPNDYKSDPKVAAFLGYSDLGAFRKARFSPMVRKVFALFVETCTENGKTIPKLHHALHIWGDSVFDSDESVERFPSLPGTIKQKYPIDSNDSDISRSTSARHYEYRLMSVLYNMARWMLYPPKVAKSTEALNDVEQDWSNLSLPPLPSVDLGDIEYPVVWPRSDGAKPEEEVIMFERCFAMLKSLQLALGPSKLTAFIDQDSNAYKPNVFKQQAVQAKFIPDFMRPIGGDSISDLLKTSKALPTTLQYVRHTETVADRDLEQHINAYVVPNGLQMLSLLPMSINDPTKWISGEEWRDDLRRRFGLQDLYLDLDNMNVSFRDANDVQYRSEVLYNARDQSRTIEWTRFRQATSDAAKIVINFSVKPYPVGEDYAFEYDGVPSTLSIDIGVRDDEVQPLHNTGIGTGSGSSTGLETGTGTGPESPTGPNTGTNTGPESSTGPNTGTGTEPESSTGPNTGTGTEPESSTGFNTGIKAGPESSAGLTQADGAGLTAAQLAAKQNMEAAIREFRKIIEEPSTLHAAVQPKDIFADDAASHLHYFDGIDVLTTAGLIQWQRLSIESVSGIQPRAGLRNSGAGVLPRDIRTAIDKAQRELERESFSLDISNVSQSRPRGTTPRPADIMVRQVRADAAFAGNELQTGPAIDWSRAVLGMKECGRLPPLNTMSTFQSTILPDKSTVTFLDHQINGAVWMLLRTYGSIPVHGLLSESPEACEASRQLSAGPRTFGGIIADTMGLGKTYTCLLFLVMRLVLPNLLHEPYRPTLLLVPSGIVLSQWVGALKSLPGMSIIVSYGDRTLSSLKAEQWVSATGMREAPESLKNWPKSARYIFDTKDSRAAQTVLISTLETFSERSLDRVLRSDPESESADASLSENILERGVFGIKKHSIYEYVTKWKGVFETVIVDEAHDLRHQTTKRYQAVRQLEAKVHWFLTATPYIRDPMDVISLYRLLWPAIANAIAVDEEANAWVTQNQSQADTDFLKAASALGRSDMARLSVLNPDRLSKIVQSGDLALIRQHLHPADETLMLRRTDASTLKFQDNSRLSLENLVAPHSVQTVDLSMKQTEAVEYQYLHRSCVARYVGACKEIGRARTNPERYSMLPEIGAALREMTVLTMSTLLIRFNLIAQRLGYSILVESLNIYRSRGFHGQHFIALVHRDTDPPIETGRQRLSFITQGSPKARFFLSEIKTYVVGAPTDGSVSKLLVVEEEPAAAWFLSLVCDILHLRCGVIHSALDDTERITLITAFNNRTNPLRILIITYGVSMQGVNLHTACSRVLVCTSASSIPVEAQAWGRAVRVHQTQAVRITKLNVLNSHDLWRETRQVDKAVPDLAMRAQTIATIEYLVSLLNDENVVIKQAHESPRGQKILNGRQVVPLSITAPTWLHTDVIGDISSVSQTSPVQSIPAQRITGRGEPVRKRSRMTRHEVDDEDSGSESDDSDTARDDWIETLRGINSIDASEERRLRKDIMSMSQKAQDSFNPEDLIFFRYLALNPSMVYTTADLNDDTTLRRAFRLLLRAKFGQRFENIRLTPHITYDTFPNRLRQALNLRSSTDEVSVRTANSLLTQPSQM